MFVIFQFFNDFKLFFLNRFLKLEDIVQSYSKQEIFCFIKTQYILKIKRLFVTKTRRKLNKVNLHCSIYDVGYESLEHSKATAPSDNLNSI
ncbi:hypothetical protein BpHYR1_027219 [Brachionus plicatilis]|uniref:Uncharacterized protein n=1 Tax=Brachionus plicatilis TaxID=10195 RepID=A0A3M7T8H3_BRAPC|nr:hypothetical protein BpHYR1_027219 [Brachionus plicatilis]